MAQSTVTSDGSVLIVPASSVSTTVASAPTGLATSGVIAIVGEAEEGPAWNAPGESLKINTYGPGDFNKVQAKYGSGRIVDAFSNMLAPSAGQKVSGAPTKIITVKTNPSTPASSTFADNSGSFTAKQGGTAGNLINYNIVEQQPEVAPTTGQFTYIPNSSAASLAVRVNGGSKQTTSISANTTPTAFASLISGLNNLNAVGGLDRGVLAGLTGINIALTVVSGKNVNISLATGQVFASQPQVGDTLSIPTGSVLAGAGNANVGWYVVTAVSNSTALAQISATAFVITPTNVTPTPISATPSNDLVDYSSVQVNDVSGTNRSIITAPLIGTDVAVTVSGSNATFTLATGSQWATSPVVGDLVYIPGGSAFEGAGNANVGWYQITSTSNTVVLAAFTATRLTNGTPVAVASTAIVVTTDIQYNDPQIKGDGKAIELYDNTGAVNVNALFLQLGTTTAVTWLSSGTTPQLLTSSEELEDEISVIRSSTNSSESYSVGGNIVLEVGYQPASPTGTATLTIAKVSNVLTLTTSVSGGPGANLNINLSKVPSINDLVAIINSNPGYSAEAYSSAAGLRSASVLDNVSAIGICSENGADPGKIKSDAFDLSSALSTSALVKYTPTATAGLPDPQSTTFLFNGLRGGSSNNNFLAAVNALQGVMVNFVDTLISQDATVDIAEGDTDGSSTYQISFVNDVVKSHCISMSVPKIKRNRQGFLSIEDTFVNQQAAAQDIANYRCSMTFEDMIQPSPSANANVQFQPWMSACVASAFQAAAFSKTIFNKAVNCIGIASAAGDYDNGNLSDQETALEAGLLPLTVMPNGQINYVSDQTTYSTDNNFVYNSIQAVYTSDLIAVDLAQSLQAAFVGDVTADVTETGVTSFIKAKMRQYLNLKLTAGTTAFPTGWVSINVNISVPVMTVQCVCIESTGIYFIPISLIIQGVQSSS